MATNIITSFIPIVDSNGVPYGASRGTRVFVLDVGTSTPKAVFTNEGLSIAADNPIDVAEGRHAIRYIAPGTYKIVTEVDGNDTLGSGTTLANYSWDNIDPGVGVGSGALPVANGGTGATTAAAARTNLGAASASDMATAQSDIANLNTWTGYTLTTRSRIASGTTAQQPAAGTIGFRYNNTTGFFEADNGSNWKNLLRQGQLLPADFATGQALICVKRSLTLSTANTAFATVIPADTSIPQISEGTEIFSVSFTPLFATSTLRFRTHLICANNTNAEAVNLALFKGLTADAIAAKTQYQPVANNAHTIIFEHEQSSAAASAVTYSVRAGSTAGTLTINGSSAYTLGGLQKSYFLIEEWVAP